MTKPQLTNVLSQLHNLLAPVKGRWIIIGTSSLMLSGYDVVPDDIDILTDNNTALLINQALKQFEVPVKLKDDGKFASKFSRYIIDGLSIELMGNLQVNTAGGWVDLLSVINTTTEVLLNDNLFKVPSKNDQIKIYTLFGRDKDKAALKLLNAI